MQIVLPSGAHRHRFHLASRPWRERSLSGQLDAMHAKAVRFKPSVMLLLQPMPYAAVFWRSRKSSRVLPSTSKSLSHLGAVPLPLHSWPCGPRYFAGDGMAAFLPLLGDSRDGQEGAINPLGASLPPQGQPWHGATRVSCPASLRKMQATLRKPRPAWLRSAACSRNCSRMSGIPRALTSLDGE